MKADHGDTIGAYAKNLKDLRSMYITTCAYGSIVSEAVMKGCEDP